MLFDRARFQFFVPILFGSTLGRLGFLMPGFRVMRIAETNFAHNSLLNAFWADFVYFRGCLGSSFSDFCCPGERLENC